MGAEVCHAEQQGYLMPAAVPSPAGFAAGGDAWLPNIAELLGRALLPCTLEMCVFDNRGVGASSVPSDKAQYSTRRMAADALALMVSQYMRNPCGWQGGAKRGCSLSDHALRLPPSVPGLQAHGFNLIAWPTQEALSLISSH